MFDLVRRRKRAFAAGGLAAGAVFAALSVGVAPALADNYNYTAVYSTSGDHTNYSTSTAENSLMIGSGSSTTYFMMQAMDTLFNDSPGCQIFDPAGNNQPLNFACVVNDKTDTTTNTNEGDVSSVTELGPVAGADQFNGINENPYNDVSVQEPFLGSSNGIAQLEDANGVFKNTCSKAGSGAPSPACPPAVIAYARSSRAIGESSTTPPVVTDDVGLNFVAYAEDGVDWLHFTETPSTYASPSSGLTNLTGSQLAQIWTGQVSNWAQITGNWTTDNAPICVYTAQDGSGTLATWDTLIATYGATEKSEAAIQTLTPNYSAAQAAAAAVTDGDLASWNGTFSGGNPGCVNGTSYTYNSSTNTVTEGTAQNSLYAGDHQIFENETEQLIAVSSGNSSTNGYADVQDSIFFMSYGRFRQICTPKVTAKCSPSGYKVAMGDINSIAPTEKDIVCGDEPVGPLDCHNADSEGEIFPGQRYLYNIYGNGDTSGAEPVNPATAATLNYVSEIGFICKPQTYTQTEVVKGKSTTVASDIIDPNTGVWYRTEIQSAITKAGFFPVPYQTAEDVGTVANSAAALMATYNTAEGGTLAYTYADPYSSIIGGPQSSGIQSQNLGSAGEDPPGYCKVYTTG